jgi:hypothetical protein
MDPIQLSRPEALIWVAALNAGVSFVLGIIPLCFGYFLDKRTLGITAIFVATGVGAILGIYVSVPLIALFLWLIIEDKRVRMGISALVFLLGISLAIGAFIRMGEPGTDDLVSGWDPVVVALTIGGSILALTGLILFILSLRIQKKGLQTTSFGAEETD